MSLFRKFFPSVLLLFGVCSARAAASCSSSMPYVFVATSPLSYVTTNSNNNFLLTCSTTVDNTQVGAAGFFASQINPTSLSNATFGGTQTYSFQAYSTTTVPLRVEGLSGQTSDLIDVENQPGGSPVFWIAPNGSVTSSGGYTGTGLNITGSAGISSIVTGGITDTGPSTFAGITNSGLAYSDQLQAATGGTHSQVMPLIFAGSAVNGQSNTHVEVVPLTFGSPSGQATGTFTKPFDANPGCTAMYTGTGLLSNTIPAIQGGASSTTFSIWGYPTYTASLTCTGT